MTAAPFALLRRPLRPADATGDAPPWEPHGEAWSLDDARDQVRSPLEPLRGDWIVATERREDAPDEGAAFVVLGGELAGEVPGVAWTRWDTAARELPENADAMVVTARERLSGAASVWPLLVMVREVVRSVAPEAWPVTLDILRAFVEQQRRRAIAEGHASLSGAPAEVAQALFRELNGILPGYFYPAARAVTAPPALAQVIVENLHGLARPERRDVVRRAAFTVCLDTLLQEHVAAEREADRVRAMAFGGADPRSLWSSPPVRGFSTLARPRQTVPAAARLDTEVHEALARAYITRTEADVRAMAQALRKPRDSDAADALALVDESWRRQW